MARLLEYCVLRKFPYNTCVMVSTDLPPQTTDNVFELGRHGGLPFA